MSAREPTKTTETTEVDVTDFVDLAREDTAHNETQNEIRIEGQQPTENQEAGEDARDPEEEEATNQLKKNYTLWVESAKEFSFRNLSLIRSFFSWIKVSKFSRKCTATAETLKVRLDSVAAEVSIRLPRQENSPAEEHSPPGEGNRN